MPSSSSRGIPSDERSEIAERVSFCLSVLVPLPGAGGGAAPALAAELTLETVARSIAASPVPSLGHPSRTAGTIVDLRVVGAMAGTRGPQPRRGRTVRSRVVWPEELAPATTGSSAWLETAPAHGERSTCACSARASCRGVRWSRPLRLAGPRRSPTRTTLPHSPTAGACRRCRGATLSRRGTPTTRTSGRATSRSAATTSSWCSPPPPTRSSTTTRCRCRRASAADRPGSSISSARATSVLVQQPGLLRPTLQGRHRLRALRLALRGDGGRSTATTSTCARTPPSRRRAPRHRPRRRLRGAAGALLRVQAEGAVGELRLPVAARRHPALLSRLPRLRLHRHQPRRPPLRQPYSNRWQYNLAYLRAPREGHQQRPQHLRASRPAGGGGQLLPPGLPAPRLHRPVRASTTCATSRPSCSTRTAFSPVPTRWARPSPTRSRPSTSAVAGFGHFGRLNIDHALLLRHRRRQPQPHRRPDVFAALADDVDISAA